MIKYFAREEIDSQKWDNCVRESTNAHVYAYSDYLDAFCEEWGGLILNEYEAVMPLPYKLKFKLISYVYTPIGIQQLGVFSKSPISQQTIRSFIYHIPKKFILINLTLNYGNYTLYLNPRPNYILELGESFQKKYSQNAQRNIKKAIAARLSVEQISILYALEMYKNFMYEKGKYFEELLCQNLKNAIQKPNSNFRIESYGVFDSTSDMLSVGIFITSYKRITYMGGTTKETASNKGAGHLLIDHVAKLYSGKGEYILDFEGSTIEGVAQFYKSFGAQLQPYYHYKNWLAHIMYILKKLRFRN